MRDTAEAPGLQTADDIFNISPEVFFAESRHAAVFMRVIFIADEMLAKDEILKAGFFSGRIFSLTTRRWPLSRPPGA